MAGSSRTLDVILCIDRRRQLMEVACGLSIIRDLHASLLQKARFATCKSLFRRSSRWRMPTLFGADISRSSEASGKGLSLLLLRFVICTTMRRLRSRACRALPLRCWQTWL